MNTIPKVSVIVPVYNAEKYLHRCIDSILAQTFTDFELLLIDDGSKDKSGAICDEYAVKDSRVRVFHKENGGVSSARNLGLDNACGSYITFVDSDDYLEAKCLSTLVSQQNIDLTIVNYVCHKCFKRIIPDSVSFVLQGENVLYDFLNQRTNIGSLRTPWGKLYKKCLIDKIKLRFNEELHIAEDTIFVLQYCINCRSLEMIDNPLYNYEYSDSNKETSLARNEGLYINQYSLVFKELWRLNEQFKSSIGVEDNILYRYYIDEIFSMTLVSVLHARNCSVLKAFSSDINVQRCMAELDLSKFYGRKGYLTLQLMKKGCYRFALFVSQIKPSI